MSGLPEEELQSRGNSQPWLEQMRELKETAAQVSAARGNILQAVREVLGDHGVQEEKREEILQLTQAAIKKVLENYHQMPDWALEAIGAAIDKERTSKSYGGQGKKTWWLPPFGFSSANPPETILQPRIAPGDCWPFQGSRGHVVIRLPEQIWPTAFTIWHISKAVSPSGEVSSAPKEFAVSGVDEATAETLLGTFTYDVHKEIAQTFHVQKELPRTFRYIKFQVQSNWGNPEYTCVYRVQVHGKTASPNDHPSSLDPAQACVAVACRRCRFSRAPGCRVAWGCWGYNPQESQRQERFQMAKREAAASLEEAQKADLFRRKAVGGAAEPELIEREQWSELIEAVREQAEIKKLLTNKLQRLLERWEALQDPTAFRGKTVQADETGESLMQEMVAMRLEERLASRRHKITSWLRRLLLFLAFLQIAILILVLLKRDVLNWVLPPKLAAAFGSRPARSRFF
ncbi:uncharacterized protein WM294_014868 [Sarcoramphus papa]